MKPHFPLKSHGQPLLSYNAVESSLLHDQLYWLNERIEYNLAVIVRLRRDWRIQRRI